MKFKHTLIYFVSCEALRNKNLFDGIFLTDTDSGVSKKKNPKINTPSIHNLIDAQLIQKIRTYMD